MVSGFVLYICLYTEDIQYLPSRFSLVFLLPFCTGALSRHSSQVYFYCSSQCHKLDHLFTLYNGERKCCQGPLLQEEKLLHNFALIFCPSFSQALITRQPNDIAVVGPKSHRWYWKYRTQGKVQQDVEQQDCRSQWVRIHSGVTAVGAEIKERSCLHSKRL